MSMEQTKDEEKVNKETPIEQTKVLKSTKHEEKVNKETPKENNLGLLKAENEVNKETSKEKYLGLSKAENETPSEREKALFRQVALAEWDWNNVIDVLSSDSEKKEKNDKRKKSLAHWDWENVVDVISLDYEKEDNFELNDDASNAQNHGTEDSINGYEADSEEDLLDTADSIEEIMKNAKIPRVSVYSGRKVVRLVSYS